MITSNFPHHGGGPGGGPHPGMPQGMGPGMGGPMQMHPGGPGPGPHGPQVTQGGQHMMGMQPGVGPHGQPSAHAMAHLGPQQQQQQMMMQHQQQQMNNSMQIQQQRAYLQQQQMLQQRQAQAQAQQQHGMGGMGMNFPNGGHPGGLTPQQMQAMQQHQQQLNGVVTLPPHFTQQLEQQRLRQQAQQQQAHQAAQQAQQQQQQQMQQQMHAMQQQSSSQGQPVSQPQQGPQPQAQQGPMRPPSQMGGPREAQPSPAPQATPQQPPTPQPQGGQSNPGQAQPPPIPQQNTPQQVQQAPGSQSQNQPGVQPTSGPPNPQLQQQMTATPLQQQQQQQQQLIMRRMAQAQSAQRAQNGQLILKLILFTDRLGQFTVETNKLENWQQFVRSSFSDDASFNYICAHKDNAKSKLYDVPAASLARFYMAHFEGSEGVNSMRFSLEGLNETVSQTGGVVHANRAKLIYEFKDGTQLICGGTLAAIFSMDDKIEFLHFESTSSQDYIPREKLLGLFAENSPVQMIKQSPKLNKNAKNRNQRQQQQQSLQRTIQEDDIPKAPVNDWGLLRKVGAYLELSETLSHMQLLMGHYVANPNMSVSAALNDYVMKTQAAQGQQQLGPGNMPPGVRTPSGANFGPGQGQQYMSPALANVALPHQVNGSPHLMQTHTPSPASHNLATQHSQQGTNSSATASASTSPNVSNKRRRSTVKQEGDDGEMNGTNSKTKPSPRVGNNNKRVKSGA